MKNTLMMLLLCTLSWVFADVQLEEGFEGATFPSANWSQIDNDGDGNVWGSYTYEPHSGTMSASSASWIQGKNIERERGNTEKDKGALTPDNYLITPQISIPAEGSKLTFWVAAQDGSYPEEHYEVMVSETGNSDVGDFVSIYEETLQNDVWHEVTLSLAVYAGKDIYIAFVHNEVTDMFCMKLDDIKVETLSSTPELAVVPETQDFGMLLLEDSRAYDFTMANISGGSLEIGSDGITITGTGSDQFVLDLSNITFPLVLEGATNAVFNVTFTPNAVGLHEAVIQIVDNTKAVYEVEIKGIGYSPLENYSQNFDEVETPYLPQGWSQFIESSSSWPKVRTDDTGNSEPNALSIECGDDYPSAVVIGITPKFTSFTDHWIRFQAFGASCSIIVGTMTDPADATTFSQISEVSLSENYAEYKVLFDTYEGDDAFVAFKYGLGAENANICIDDVVWELSPTAPIFQITPEEYNFGLTTIGNEAVKSFEIKNIGVGVMEIGEEDIVITGSDAALFSLDFSGIDFPIQLEANQSQDIIVKFNPNSTGLKNAVIQINDNIAKTEHEVVISGTGFEGISENFEIFPPAGWTNDKWFQTEGGVSGQCAAVQYNHEGEAILETFEFAFSGEASMEFQWIDKDYWGAKDGIENHDSKVANHDTTFCEISNDGGITWVILARLSATAAETEFHKETIDLTPYAGTNVKIRWRDVNDESYNAYGTALDDVKIQYSTLGIEDEILPEYAKLYQNYPNPFNPSTTIKYELGAVSSVNIAVFNAKGEKVWQAGEKKVEAGKYAVQFDGSSLNSGIYFYSLEIGGIVKQTKKMILIK